MTTKDKNSNHYVSNADLLEALKKYRVEVVKAKENGVQSPIVPNYIGDCFIKIANGLSMKGNFASYSYLDEMRLDGIENCIKVVNCFNPEKYSNPFAYFTTVTYWAFVRRIMKEKKQSYIKGMLVQDMLTDNFDVQMQDEDEEYRNAYTAFVQAHQNFDDSFIRKKEEKKKAKIAKVANSNKPTLEEFFDDKYKSEMEVLSEESIENMDPEELIKSLPDLGDDE